MTPRAVRPSLVATAIASGLIAIAGACSEPSPAPSSTPALTNQQLLDPTQCATCHPSHFDAWSGSMHAYASDDPLFVAMNARFQRDTGGSQPGFCVQCHAPMALREGATTDGSQLASVPSALHGVTCAFCHSVDAVDGANDDPLQLASDGVMRAEIDDPSPPPPHGSMRSPLLDSSQAQAATSCGACHDVTTPQGVAVETTFAEWQAGLYSQSGPNLPLTCGGCHMPASQGTASSLPNAPVRTVHDHSFAAVDTATTAFPNAAAQQAAIAKSLGTAIVSRLCVEPASAAGSAAPSSLTVTLTLDNAFVGHSWPSGASHDRRAWVELVASSAGAPVYQSGVVPAGQDVTTLDDPDLWLFRETLFDATSNEVKLMWQAASTAVSALPVAVTTDPNDPRYVHSLSKTYTVPAATDSVAVQLLMTPVGLDVVGELVASGDLDPSYATQIPVYVMSGASVTWTLAGGFGCVP